MTWPTSSVRTKDWASEILTDADLEAQFDILHTYINDFLNGTSGHGHSGGDGDGAQIDLTLGVTGVLPEANGGTGLSSGFLNGGPIGAIIIWPTVSAPTNHLICDGSAVSRNTYADLFTVLSTAYGVGDGATTFNLPNLKGKVPVGYNASDTDFDAIGETGGEKTHTMTEAELVAHNHRTPAGQEGGGAAFGSQAWSSGSATYGTYGDSEDTGSGTPFNVMQPYITLNFCIRYQ